MHQSRVNLCGVDAIGEGLVELMCPCIRAA